MKLTSVAYSRTLPIGQRRALIVAWALSTLASQLLLPSVRSESLLGSLPLLLIPLALALHFVLFSDAWEWNRLFRRDALLDEYERYARNAFLAQAYFLHRFLSWLVFAAFLVGGGMLHNTPILNVFASANFEVAVLVFIAVLMSLFELLPRAIAAWREDLSNV